MSQVDFYIALGGKEYALHDEFSNGWGFGPRIWITLCEKYNLGSPLSQEGHEAMQQGILGSEWPLSDKVAYALTYLNIIVEREVLFRTAELLEEFDRAHHQLTAGANHLPGVASMLRVAEAAKDHLGVVRVDSVNRDWWHEHVQNEESGEWEPYDFGNPDKGQESIYSMSRLLAGAARQSLPHKL